MSKTELVTECFAATDKGKRRDLNEDAYICDPDKAIFVVADGMGGENYGEVASQLTVDHFSQLITPFVTDEDTTIPFDVPDDGDHFTGALNHAVEGANKAVYEYAAENESHKGMGSTLTAAVLHGDFLYVAHVGDSRLYRILPDEVQQITEDHSRVQEMVQKGLLSPEEARSHPQKNIITRCVGRKKRIRSDILTIDLLDEDVFLLCSDGLNDMLEDESIHQIVTESGDLETAANLLVQAANDKGGKDNITVVLFRLHSQNE